MDTWTLLMHDYSMTNNLFCDIFSDWLNGGRVITESACISTSVLKMGKVSLFIDN